MHRAIPMIAGAALLSACAKEPPAWTRVDGLPIGSQSLAADRLACRGQVEAAAVQGQARSTVDSPLGMDRADYRIFLGCMAGKGYLPQNTQN